MRHLRLIIGLSISIFCLWLAFKDIQFNAFLSAFKKIDLVSFAKAVICFNIAVFLRSWRWYYILKAIKKIPLRRCFNLTCIGYLTNNIVPARLGDVVKGALLKRSGLMVIQGIATVLLERIFDLAILLLIFVTIISTATLPIEIPESLQYWSRILGIGVAIFIMLATAFIRLDIYKTPRFLQILDHLPDFLGSRLRSLTEHIHYGFMIFKKPRMLAQVVTVNVSSWLVDGLVPFFLLSAFQIPFDYFSSLLLIVVVAISNMVPAAPGNVGVFQKVCQLFLAPFAIADADVLAFAVMWNMLMYIDLTILGVVALAAEKIGLQDITKIIKPRRQTNPQTN